jgi:5'-methylthioadenosine phosphorylase
MDAEIGIIGGSGFYSLFENPKKVDVETKYGKPSDSITLGSMCGKKVAFLPRHGSRHSIPPHKVPYRANIDAMAKLGVKRILATNAIGSLKEEYAPRDFVFFDQYVNLTNGRADTFFDEDKVAHISAAEPYCPELRGVASEASDRLGIRHHDAGTIVVINGPRFSTKAESRFFSAQGFDVIGMTQYPEATLAREREICYLGIGMVTDYDAGLDGKSEIKAVTAGEVAEVFAGNIENAKRLVSCIIGDIPAANKCSCQNALLGAVMGH